MAIKDLVSNLVDKKLIRSYQLEVEEENQWTQVKCKLSNEKDMIISKLDETETKESFQNQFKEYLSSGQTRIIAYYTSKPQKITDWIEEINNNHIQGLLIICLNEEKENKFINKLQEIIR
ncbi:hypothetical protein JCM16358_02660 [Halanaerocella petrolearia]